MLHRRNPTKTQLDDPTLSSVHRIPAEVLCQIFSNCQTDDDISANWRWLTTLNVNAFTPWKLAQVSKYWRQTAIGFSQLWTEVAMVYDYDGHSRYKATRGKHTHFLLDLQLQRSARQPLAVYMAFSSNWTATDEGLMKRLLPTSSRWQRLFLSTGIQDFQHIVTIKNQLDSLQVLYLFCKTRGLHTYEWNIFNLFTNTPNLHTVMGDAEFFRLLPAHAIPWSKIRHYHESLAPLDNPVSNGKIFSFARNLCFCTINHHHLLSTWFISQQPATFELPALQQMTVGGVTLDGVDEWLGTLRLPALESLHFKFKRQLGVSAESLCIALRRFPLLKELSIQISSFGTMLPAIVPLLQSIEALRTLELELVHPEALIHPFTSEMLIDHEVERAGLLGKLIAERPDVAIGLRQIIFRGLLKLETEMLKQRDHAFNPLRAARPELAIEIAK